MFGFFRRLFRRGPLRPEDYAEELDSLDKRSKALENALRARDAAHRRWIKTLFLLAIVASMAIAGYRFFVEGPPLKHWPAAIPFLVLLFVRKMLVAYHSYRVERLQQSLSSIEDEKASKVAELKERMQFDRTREVIAKYGTPRKVDLGGDRGSSSLSGAGKGKQGKGAPGSSGKGTGAAGPGGKRGASSASAAANAGAAAKASSSTTSSTSTSSSSSSSSSSLSSSAASSSKGTGAKNGAAAQSSRAHASPSAAAGGDPEGSTGRHGGADGGFVGMARDRSTLTKVVDFLTNDGPANRYALICQRCFAHNGLARPEAMGKIKYRCPHCGFFNDLSGGGGGGVEDSSPDPSTPKNPRGTKSDSENEVSPSLKTPGGDDEETVTEKDPDAKKKD